MLKAEQTERNGLSRANLGFSSSTHDLADRAEVVQAHPDSPAAKKVAELFALGDIRINGDRPWDIQVHDQRLYRRVLVQGSLGAGESYVDGWWDVEALDEFFARIYRADPYENLGRWRTVLMTLKGLLFNRQTITDARNVARQHYDLGNDLYLAMLDHYMQYSCGYWARAQNLEDAQRDKLNLIARKLHLNPGMSVLELGGGFGGLAEFLALQYGCRVVSYNISSEQVAFARQRCAALPVRFELKDYRDAIHEPTQFDRVVAIGLCEHIGYKNYGRFFSVVRDRLRDEGLFLLHSIGGNESTTSTDEWFDKYIFRNGMMPSLKQLTQAAEHHWVIEDVHNFGPDYDKTLMAWWHNFNEAWPALASKYGERFYRMWRYYLLSSAGTFRARKLQLWQMVLSKGDIPSYAPVR